MKTFWLIILLLSVYTIHGQEERKYLMIYTNILQNIDISHPQLNLGMERAIFKRQSISAGLGYYYKNWMYSEPAKGINVNMEYKKLLAEDYYVAIGMNYGKLSYGDTTINKMLYDLYLKIGQRIIMGRFNIDCFVGVGFRYKETRITEKVSDNYKPVDITLLGVRDNEGDFRTAIIKWGFVFGLNLKK